ncbi:PDR/VanB family oxidoreductase [Ottowia sp. VDI28]|uniref:PDR/VanB family oxidoreductase n=1 Tax=Ottowia sp. VDI28 TaxID=3133968 RepID=UPI003C2C8B6B
MNQVIESLRVRVARKDQTALGITSFELVSADGVPLPAFEAGSHVDVAVPGGLTRQYSLCNDPSESHRYQIAVLNVPDGRGGSRAMHEAVHLGDVLVISKPRNHFPLANARGHSLLLAGGIGITPLLCMAERLAQMDRPFTLHYFARSAERAAFIGRIRASRFSAHAHFHFDEAPAAPPNLQALLVPAGADAHLYTCGPKGFMDAVLACARSGGWADDQLHQEYFSAEPVTMEGDGAFEVQLASSGRVVPIAADQTVIAALAAQGVHIETSCEQGVCGTCLTRVLGGEPDHRDVYLTAAEQASNDQFLPCCSRAKSGRLVLDL